MDEHARPLDVVGDDADVGADSAASWSWPTRRVAGSAASSAVVGRMLEARRHALDDRPQHVLLGRHVGVQAGALDIHGARDVADARAGVAPLAEQGAGGVLDLAATVGLDHASAS